MQYIWNHYKSVIRDEIDTVPSRPRLASAAPIRPADRQLAPVKADVRSSAMSSEKLKASERILDETSSPLNPAPYSLPLFVLLRSHRAVPRSSSLRPPSQSSCCAPLFLSSSSFALIVPCSARPLFVFLSSHVPCGGRVFG